MDIHAAKSQVNFLTRYISDQSYRESIDKRLENLNQRNAHLSIRIRTATSDSTYRQLKFCMYKILGLSLKRDYSEDIKAISRMVIMKDFILRRIQYSSDVDLDEIKTALIREADRAGWITPE